MTGAGYSRRRRNRAGRSRRCDPRGGGSPAAAPAVPCPGPRQGCPLPSRRGARLHQRRGPQQAVPARRLHTGSPHPRGLASAEACLEHPGKRSHSSCFLHHEEGAQGTVCPAHHRRCLHGNLSEQSGRHLVRACPLLTPTPPPAPEARAACAPSPHS